MTADDTIRFCVGEPAGARSSPWFMRYSGHETFVGHLGERSMFHMSAHRHECHIALTPPPVGASKYPHTFDHPTELCPGVQRVMSVLVPDDSVVAGSRTLENSDQIEWVPPPGDGWLCEFVVLRVWFDRPGQSRFLPPVLMNAALVGIVKKAGSWAAVVVLRRPILPIEYDTMERGLQPLAQRRRAISDGPIRGGLWGDGPDDGSWMFFDLAVP